MFHYEFSCWWACFTVFGVFKGSVSLTHPICFRQLLSIETHLLLHFQNGRKWCIRSALGSIFFPGVVLRRFNTSQMNQQWEQVEYSYDIWTNALLSRACRCRQRMRRSRQRMQQRQSLIQRRRTKRGIVWKCNEFSFNHGTPTAPIRQTVKRTM